MRANIVIKKVMAPAFTIMLIFAVIYPVVGQNRMGLHILHVLAVTMEIEFSAAMGAHSRTMAAATTVGPTPGSTSASAAVIAGTAGPGETKMKTQLPTHGCGCTETASL